MLRIVDARSALVGRSTSRSLKNSCTKLSKNILSVVLHGLFFLGLRRGNSRHIPSLHEIIEAVCLFQTTDFFNKPSFDKMQRLDCKYLLIHQVLDNPLRSLHAISLQNLFVFYPEPPASIEEPFEKIPALLGL